MIPAAVDPGEAGFLPELGMCYAFDERILHLWKTGNPENTKQVLPAFPSYLIGIKAVQDPSSKAVLLLVLTTEEIHFYSVKHNADQTFVVTPFQAPVSTDRTKYSVIYQTKKGKKIFIGGDNGKIAELKVEGASDSKSRALMVVRYLKKKVIGDG